MAALFVILLALLITSVIVLVIADRRVTRAGSWESIDRWLVAGSYAAPAVFMLSGAVVGVGLAWWVS